MIKCFFDLTKAYGVSDVNFLVWSVVFAYRIVNSWVSDELMKIVFFVQHYFVFFIFSAFSSSFYTEECYD